MTLVCTLVAMVTHRNCSRTKLAPNFYSLSRYEVALFPCRGEFRFWRVLEPRQKCVLRERTANCENYRTSFLLCNSNWRPNDVLQNNGSAVAATLHYCSNVLPTAPRSFRNEVVNFNYPYCFVGLDNDISVTPVESERTPLTASTREITLKCRVNGSADMKISWLRWVR